MSIILKGIDMPTNGETLIVGIYGNGLVSMEYTKPLALAIEINAEAIQIPKGHGRLIDGDTLYKFFEDALNKNPLDDWWEAGAVLDNIEIAPTILEAEE